jgi:hypothetical protein
MTNSFKSSGSDGYDVKDGKPKGWIKVGLVAAATAFAGGIMAAWWYRQTIMKLRQAESDAQNPHFGISEDNPTDEV